MPPATLPLAVILAATLAAPGCAPAPGQPTRGAEPVTPATPSSARAEPADPFQVASQWAAELSAPHIPDAPARALPAEIARITDAWSSAQLARLWAQGEEYRALVTQKNTAGQGPAVLLRLGTDASGAWQVIGLEPATATVLWSHL